MSRFAKKWLGFEAWIKAIISTVKYTPAVKLQRMHTHTHTRFVLHLDCEGETRREEETRINRRKIESEKEEELQNDPII